MIYSCTRWEELDLTYDKSFLVIELVVFGTIVKKRRQELQKTVTILSQDSDYLV